MPILKLRECKAYIQVSHLQPEKLPWCQNFAHLPALESWIIKIHHPEAHANLLLLLGLVWEWLSICSSLNKHKKTNVSFLYECTGSTDQTSSQWVRTKSQQTWVTNTSTLSAKERVLRFARTDQWLKLTQKIVVKRKYTFNIVATNNSPATTHPCLHQSLAYLLPP